MIAALTDRVDAVVARFPRLFMVVGAAWMVLTALDYGRLIDLPSIPFLTGVTGMVAAGIYNAIWWGFVNPRVERRRSARAAMAAQQSEVAAHG